jgi:hypothetical protein
MNIYYTAKDIEAFVAKGIYEIELGPNTSLTDFARETAEQLDVALIDGAQDAQEPARVTASQSPSPRPQAVSVSQTYSKPRGCQTGAPSAISRTANVPETNTGKADPAPINRLVDLMGKIIRRGD